MIDKCLHKIENNFKYYAVRTMRTPFKSTQYALKTLLHSVIDAYLVRTK